MSRSNAYLAFYIANKGKFLDNAISLIDGSRFSHVELVLNHASNGQYTCISSSHRDGGLRSKLIDLQTGKWFLVSVDCDIDYAWQWFNARQGAKYDYIGLLCTKFRQAPQISNRYFCSEACAAMLQLDNPSSYGVKQLYEWAISKGDYE